MAGCTHQITDGAGPASDAPRAAETARVCPPIQSQDIHAASTLCVSGSENVLQDRLSWHHRDPARLRCPAQFLGAEAHSPLYYCPEGKSAAAPSASSPTPVPRH